MPKHHVIRPDVKAQILKRLKEDGVPVATLAEEHGISTKTIWDSSKLCVNYPEIYVNVGERLARLLLV